DVGCDESVIRNLLSLVENAGSFPIDQLVDEVEKRNRLKLLHRWLEGRMAANSQDQAVYNALAKIYIDSNFNAERFLTENKLYDHRVVGKYCEKRDPSLAFIAYQQGQCDMELLQLTNDNAMFKQQARYLMKRRDQQLWTNALDAENPNRGSVVDQVISAALPEATDPEEVSIAVRAFMGAELFGDLIELLEKVVLENPIFGEYKSLQNLLLMTAIRHDSSRVMGYLERLSNYDAAEIASLAVANGLTEEALTIYRKNDAHTEAIGVLIDHIGDLERAQEFAERVDEPETWSRLAKTQLDNLRIQDAIDSYIRANDPSNYIEVIGVTNRAAKFTELIPFLTMARKTVREPLVESELAFAYAQTNRLADLQDMLSEPNIVQVQLVGDRCFDMGLYSAARIFFTNVSNWGRLASTLVRLEDYGAAVDAARKANSVMVWKDVHSACIEQREFRLAQTCGLNIIVHADELESLVAVYENSGLVEEAMKMLETGLGLERAHMGMFTELAILYVKYRPESIMDHLKLYWSRINIPKVIRACELAHLWPELVFLYVHYDEFDSAATTIMEHAA
ncbi:ARM repeat-containing protein, partial [Ramicandelaber brevisporus]